MKEVVYTNYGAPDVLQLKGVEKHAPERNEVLVKIHATTVTRGDTNLRGLKIPGPVVTPPKSILPNNTLVSIPPYRAAGILPVHSRAKIGTMSKWHGL